MPRNRCTDYSAIIAAQLITSTKKKWTEHIYIVILPATDYIKFSEPTADGMDDK